MNKHRIGALIAAAALTLTFAGTALADGTVDWTGNGISAGQFNNEQCDAANPAGTMLWVFSPSGNDSVTAAELTVNGTNYGAMNQDNGQWKLRIPLIAPGDVDSASVPSSRHDTRLLMPERTEISPRSRSSTCLPEPGFVVPPPSFVSVHCWLAPPRSAN
jgi:hypothetical protein